MLSSVVDHLSDDLKSYGAANAPKLQLACHRLFGEANKMFIFDTGFHVQWTFHLGRPVMIVQKAAIFIVCH